MTPFEIITQYKTTELALKYLLKYNKSNLAPYHNLNHMLTVMKHCWDAMDFMNLLNRDKVEEMLVAAMFHDYNHSMGKRDDAYNISQAKEGLKYFVKFNTNMKLDLEFMFKIIDATQYPYVLQDHELNVYQSIIRDADLMQILEPDWMSHVILGLCDEMHYPLDELMVGEKKFLRNITMITPYGKYMQKMHGKQVWENFKTLEKILR